MFGEMKVINFIFGVVVEFDFKACGIMSFV